VTQPLASTTRYWVRVSSPAAAGCGSTSVDSAAVTVSVCQLLSITQHPYPNIITSTHNVNLTVAVTGSGALYQWYEGRTGVTTKPVGTNSPTLTIRPTTTKYYWVRVSSSCGAPSVDSADALQSVVPEFTTNPANAAGVGYTLT
jgi:hypothetical protein